MANDNESDGHRILIAIGTVTMLVAVGGFATHGSPELVVAFLLAGVLLVCLGAFWARVEGLVEVDLRKGLFRFTVSKSVRRAKRADNEFDAGETVRPEDVL